MQQPPGMPPGGYPPGGGGYGPPPGGGGGYGPPPGGGGGGYGPPPGGGGGGYGPPPGGGGGGYGPPPGGGGGYGPPPGGGGGYSQPPGGMGYGPPGVGLPPPQKGSNTALIIVIVVAVLAATGLGGCLICTFVITRPAATATAGGSLPVGGGSRGAVPTSASENWITSERPYVKFIAPPGWNKNINGDWGVFKSPDGNAVFAFTSFSQAGESTARLGAAAGVLGVGEVDWRAPIYGSVGKDHFSARMGEGSCNFGGPGGYIWYATANAGSSDQMLLIYTVSARGNKSHKDAALAAIHSLQRR